MPARKTHGVTPIRSAIAARGLDAIDKRTRPWKDVQAVTEAIIGDLGGRDQLSAQQLVLVDLVARTLYVLNHVDAYVMGLDSPLVGKGKRKTVVPVLKERGELARHLESLLARLGLERRARQLPDLRSYLATRYGHTDENGDQAHDGHQKASTAASQDAERLAVDVTMKPLATGPASTVERHVSHVMDATTAPIPRGGGEDHGPDTDDTNGSHADTEGRAATPSP